MLPLSHLQDRLILRYVFSTVFQRILERMKCQPHTESWLIKHSLVSRDSTSLGLSPATFNQCFLHLPNQLLALTSLSQGVLLGKPKMRHENSDDLSFSCSDRTFWTEGRKATAYFFPSLVLLHSATNVPYLSALIYDFNREIEGINQYFM